MGTNEENIFENFVCFSKVEPEPDLYTGSNRLRDTAGTGTQSSTAEIISSISMQNSPL